MIDLNTASSTESTEPGYVTPITPKKHKRFNTAILDVVLKFKTQNLERTTKNISRQNKRVSLNPVHHCLGFWSDKIARVEPVRKVPTQVRVLIVAVFHTTSEFSVCVGIFLSYNRDKQTMCAFDVVFQSRTISCPFTVPRLIPSSLPSGFMEGRMCTLVRFTSCVIKGSLP